MGFFDNLVSGVGGAFDLTQKDFTTTGSTSTAAPTAGQNQLLSGITDFVGTQNQAATSSLGSLNNIFNSDKAKNLFSASQDELGRALNPNGLGLSAEERNVITNTFGDSRRQLQQLVDATVGNFGSDAAGTNLASNIADQISQRNAEEAKTILDLNERKKSFASATQESLARQQLGSAETRLKLAGLTPPGTDVFNTLSDIQRANTTKSETKPGPTETEQFGTLAAGIGALLQGLGGGGSGGQITNGMQNTGLLGNVGNMLSGILNVPANLITQALSGLGIDSGVTGAIGAGDGLTGVKGLFDLFKNSDLGASLGLDDLSNLDTDIYSDGGDILGATGGGEGGDELAMSFAGPVMTKLASVLSGGSQTIAPAAAKALASSFGSGSLGTGLTGLGATEAAQLAQLAQSFGSGTSAASLAGATEAAQLAQLAQSFGSGTSLASLGAIGGGGGAVSGGALAGASGATGAAYGSGAAAGSLAPAAGSLASAAGLAIPLIVPAIMAAAGKKGLFSPDADQSTTSEEWNIYRGTNESIENYRSLFGEGDIPADLRSQFDTAGASNTHDDLIPASRKVNEFINSKLKKEFGTIDIEQAKFVKSQRDSDESAAQQGDPEAIQRIQDRKTAKNDRIKATNVANKEAETARIAENKAAQNVQQAKADLAKANKQKGDKKIAYKALQSALQKQRDIQSSSASKFGGTEGKRLADHKATLAIQAARRKLQSLGGLEGSQAKVDAALAKQKKASKALSTARSKASEASKTPAPKITGADMLKQAGLNLNNPNVGGTEIEQQLNAAIKRVKAGGRKDEPRKLLRNFLDQLNNSGDE